MTERQSIRPLSGYFGHFMELVGQISTPTLLPMLSARQRWQILMELLLGHARVRGGRTRDYAFSRQRRLTAQLSSRLCETGFEFSPGQNDQAVWVSFYDALVALHLVELARAGESGNAIDAERHYTSALLTVIGWLFAEDDQASVIEQFGISDQGQERSAAGRRAFDRQSLRLAQIMAAVTRTPLQPQPDGRGVREAVIEHFSLRPAHIEQLDGLSVDLMFLKIKKAQTFLDACRKPFIQRGASAWCSQIASRFRDLLTEQLPGVVSPLVDCEAVTLLVMPSGQDSMDAQNLARVSFLCGEDDRHINRELINRHHPRLSAYYEQALAEGQSTALALPMLGCEYRRGRSLFDLCTQEPGRDEPGEGDDAAVIDLAPRPALDGRERCAGHQLSPRYKAADRQVPVWYNPSGDQAYGFVSTAFSLAEVTYTRMTGSAIRQLLSEALDRSVTLLRTQREIVREVCGDPGAPVVLLKYDGDRVGARFSGVPLMRRAGMSLSLERIMRDAWIEAVAAVMQQHDLDANPVDLLYMGGDDLMMVMPAELAQDFAKAFNECLERHQTAEPAISFSFTGVCQPVQSGGRGHEQDNGAEDSQIALIQSVNTALSAFKAANRSEAPYPDYLAGEGTRSLSMSMTQGVIVDAQRTRDIPVSEQSEGAIRE